MKRVVAQIPVIGRLASVAYRCRLPAPYVWQTFASSVGWLFTSRETTNITYALTPRNARHLAEFVSAVSGCPSDRARAYIEELDGDAELSKHIVAATRRSRAAFKSDADPRFGRRYGWYAFVRALKPRVIVETGVDKGLGGCVLAAALLRNRGEGVEGRYYGTDIDSEAGFLLAGKYREVGELILGDSIESLSKFERPIDLFISDSDHGAGYERREYEAVRAKLAPGALVLSDNAHASDALLEFAHQEGRRFLFFREDTGRFWYPGGGIGAAYTAAD